MAEPGSNGKEPVHGHHLAAPFRYLVPEHTKGTGFAAIDGSLTVNGDDLHALMPTLCGQG